MPTEPTFEPAALSAPLGLRQRLHQSLMPDYTRVSAVYWWALVSLGAGALGWALLHVAAMPSQALWQIAAGATIAMLAGLFPIRIPGAKNTFAGGEIFIFLLLLMHGPAAAALAAAEAFVGTTRTSKRWTSRLASPAVASLAMVVVGQVLHLVLDGLRAQGLYGPALLLMATLLFAMTCFLFTTPLIAALPYLKRQQMPAVAEVFGNFSWVGVTYLFSALIAALLHLAFEAVGMGALLGAVPIIVMLLPMLHYHFRQREVTEGAQALRVEAAEREAALAARHVQELSISQQRFHSAFSNAAIGMALVSTEGQVLQVNPALCALLGHEQAYILGRSFSEFVHLQGPLQQLLPQADQAKAKAVDLLCRHPQGAEVWVTLHAAVFTDTQSAAPVSARVQAPCLILQVQDITARRAAESRLQHIAYHDSLTALVNRARFAELVTQAIHRHRADARHGFALMYLDFDRFKLINDTLGHSVGDAFLVTVAQRLQAVMRPGDVIARLGGDEFAVLVQDLEQEGQTMAMAERLQATLKQPYSVAGTVVNSSASIGITFSSVGYDNADEVMRDADIAMYRAKAEGRARHVLFDARLRSEITDKVQLEADLRSAIEHDQIGVAYQPIYDLATGQVVSFEALARWHHPQRGTIAPDRFIAVAEEAGLINALSQRMLNQACAQLKAWHALDPAHKRIGMQVNLSGIDLCHDNLPSIVITALLKHGLLASHLTLEITESTLMAKLDRAMQNMARLREIGAGLSVDDFGTGYSSLSYLTTLPITSLKIDRSFVGRLSTTSDDHEVVKAIVSLGTALGKKVVAEGIETVEQLTRLRALGCRFGQGYLLAKPMPADAAEALLLASHDNAQTRLAQIAVTPALGSAVIH
jgi:diguanylate cyclase (GGDEF)-like protein/PAS domain S-box-containing protein